MVNNFKISSTLRIIRKNESKKQYLNFGEDDQMEIQGFLYNKMKNRIIWFFYIITIGLLRLFFHWYPHLQLIATHSTCNLQQAEKVLIIDNYKGKYKSYFVKRINILKPSNEFLNSNLMFHLHDGTTKQLPEARIIRCKKLTYIWDDEKNKFIKLAGLENGIKRNQLHTFLGQSQQDQLLKRIVYGLNEINVPVQTISTLLILEALTPFYMFQLFSLIVWLCENYYYYTIAIIIMSLFGISTSVIQTRKNQKNLKGTVHSSDKVVVCRSNNKLEEIYATDLVPGDRIIISQGCEMQCDAVLLSGNCIVNESMLTGESVPVTKTPIPNNTTTYSVKTDVNHTLFCGTHIIQTRISGNEQVAAVVIRTGYLTTKGELVRSILYPPPADFKFDQDSYKFIGILSVFAIAGFIYTIVSKSTRNIEPLDILIKALDLITIAIPPALPAAMTVGKLYALNRLEHNKIYCINSRVINVSGSINCVCFDKTGTLTEDALDTWGVVPIENCNIKNCIKDPSTLPSSSLLLRGMASCHSLTLIGNEVCGDPLDVKMFQSTGWMLQEINNNKSGTGSISVLPNNEKQAGVEIEILQQFQFSSTLQRLSVITKSSDNNNFIVFTKGSPETIISLSKQYTVPENLTREIQYYSQQGYRVIAIAFKEFPIIANEILTNLDRDEFENDLEFLGLIIFENKLKPETSRVIKTLRQANLKIVMITGDNILTAVHVAKECKILSDDCAIVEVVATKPTKYEFANITYNSTSKPFAIHRNGYSNGDIEKSPVKRFNFVISGNSWANVVQYFPDLVQKIVAKGVVFARMSGSQKQQLVEELKNLGYYVAMCGDGANDCGALKAAHVGISLSEAESSVASPFTSQEPNISCVPKVIKEGRAALVTSFGVFKMMLCYSLTEFASVIILYAIDSNLTSLQYLFIDVFLVLNFASFFGKTKAYKILDPQPPATSLLSFIPLSSIVFFMLTTVAFQAISYHYIKTHEWFEPFIYNHKDSTSFSGYENYAIFTVSMFQYITMAIVFSKGKPYRNEIYSNKVFSFSLVLMTIVCSYITVYPAVWLQQMLELVLPPRYDGRIAILAIALMNFFVSFIMEDGFVEYVLGRIVSPKVSMFNESNRKFLTVLDEINRSDNWPNVSNSENSVILDKVCENGKFGIVNNGFHHTETIATTKC